MQRVQFAKERDHIFWQVWWSLYIALEDTFSFCMDGLRNFMALSSGQPVPCCPLWAHPSASQKALQARALAATRPLPLYEQPAHGRPNPRNHSISTQCVLLWCQNSVYWALAVEQPLFQEVAFFSRSGSLGSAF